MGSDSCDGHYRTDRNDQSHILTSSTAMITTSFAYGDSYGVKDHYNDDERDYDDFMSAEDYDRRRALRDGWASDTRGYW